MNSKRLFYSLIGLLALVLIASVAITIYGTSMLKNTGNTLMERKLEEAVLEEDIKALDKAKQDIEKYKELDQIARSIVPKEKDQVRAIREIIQIAAHAEVTIENISFQQSSLGEKKKRSSSKSDMTQLIEVEGLKGVYAMPINVTSQSQSPISYDKLLNFLERLENNRLTSHITNISVRPDDDDRSLVHFSMQINAYIKP